MLVKNVSIALIMSSLASTITLANEVGECRKQPIDPIDLVSHSDKNRTCAETQKKLYKIAEELLVIDGNQDILALLKEEIRKKLAAKLGETHNLSAFESYPPRTLAYLLSAEQHTFTTQWFNGLSLPGDKNFVRIQDKDLELFKTILKHKESLMQDAALLQSSVNSLDQSHLGFKDHFQKLLRTRDLSAVSRYLERHKITCDEDSLAAFKVDRDDRSRLGYFSDNLFGANSNSIMNESYYFAYDYLGGIVPTKSAGTPEFTEKRVQENVTTFQKIKNFCQVKTEIQSRRAERPMIASDSQVSRTNTTEHITNISAR